MDGLYGPSEFEVGGFEGEECHGLSQAKNHVVDQPLLRADDANALDAFLPSERMSPPREDSSDMTFVTGFEG